MNRQQLLTQILQEHFPDECDIAGPTNIRLIVAGNREIVRVDYGSSLDLSHVLKDLVEVVSFVGSVLSILSAWREHRKTRLDVAGPIEAVERAGPLPAGLDAMQREAIIRRLAQWLEEDHDTPPLEPSAAVPLSEDPAASPENAS